MARNQNQIIVSVIIPYYNTKAYTDELLDCLAPQITDEVEVILIDDGSKEPYSTDYKWCKVYRQSNGGVSKARNHGLAKAQGEYICFIDSDDLVASDYIDQIKSKIPFDFLEMSWRSLPGGVQHSYKLKYPQDRLPNPSSVTRAFSRATIGDIRFNENKQAAEDAEFVQTVCKEGAKVAVVTEYLYFYRTYTPNSLSKRYLSGETDTKRIIYHHNHITANMTDLVAEIKAENEHNEVYVMTNQCDLPELKQYAKVMAPQKVRGSELRGEPTTLFTRILPIPEFDICIYTSQSQTNGIFTWIKAFCGQMCNKYNIAVLHQSFSDTMVRQLYSVAYVKRNSEPIKCKYLLMMRIGDTIPPNIRYGQSIQVLHATHTNPKWKLPTDRDLIIPVSKAVKDSWNIDTEPILNMTYSGKGENIIRLITATRFNTPEKGQSRMREFAELLRQAGIRFQWECYSDSNPNIPGITFKGWSDDIRSQIRRADYLVQLSDAEGFCYSIVEALEEGTAVITTPLPILNEIGFENGKHGYIFGFGLQGDINRLVNVPKFDYTYDNDKRKEQWSELFGQGNGKESVLIECIKRYKDVQLNRQVESGETMVVSERRATEIINAGYGRRIDGKV